MKYLGHKVSSSRITMDPDTAKTIDAYQPPTDKDKLRSLIGVASYRRAYISNFSEKAECLLKLFRKDATFEWKDEQQESYELLKSCLLKLPILRYQNFQKTFFLAMDASDNGLGSALLQKADGKFMPIS